MHLRCSRLLFVTALLVAVAASVVGVEGEKDTTKNIFALPVDLQREVSTRFGNAQVAREDKEVTDPTHSFARLLGVRSAVNSRSCFPGNAAEATGQHLETCCWYDSSTCCTPTIAGIVIPIIKGNLSTLQKEIGIGDQCYFAVADLACILCAPDSSKFIVQQLNNNVQLRICESLCDKIYSACAKDLKKIPGVPPNITNGESLCGEIFREAKEKGNIIFGKKGDKTCFDGVSLSTVEEAYCLPGQTRPNDDGSKKVIIIAVVVVVLAVVGLLVAGAGIGYFVWRRRRVNQQREIELALSTINDGGM